MLLREGRQFREALESARCANSFVRQQTTRLGGHPSQITVIGQSAAGLYGADVPTQPAWHVERSAQFIDGLKSVGRDAEAAMVEAGHEGLVWEKALEIMLDVVRA